MKKIFIVTISSLIVMATIFSGCKRHENRAVFSEVPSGYDMEIYFDKSKEVINPPFKKNLRDPVFYNIEGKSNKLSKKEVESMDKWRKDIVALARINSNDLYINGNTEDKVVALTFDDGPDLRITPKILDVLKDNNVKGSFFFIGDRVKKYPSVVKRTDEEGNLVLSHSFSHPDLSKKIDTEIEKETAYAEASIYDVIKKRPAIIRPPYGAVDERVLKQLKKTDLKSVLWSIDTLDWSQREKGNIVSNVVDNIRPGDIILMHSNEDKIITSEALPDIISKLKEKGYRFVDLSELLGIKAYK